MTLAHTGYTAGQVLRAWTPFLFLTATVTLWSIPPFKALFASGGALYEWVIKFRCRTSINWLPVCRHGQRGYGLCRRV
ncbi:L-lactate permease [Escherichia coli]